MKTSFLALALLMSAAVPASAQSVDFGDDGGMWSNDGECDDPRFEGPGMTTTPLLDADIMHDATDCRTAFESGRITLSGGANGAALPSPGGKGGQGGGAMPSIKVDGIDFGNDSGEWALDGECDDRRFFGAEMATSVSWTYVGADATDCAEAYQAGQVKLWDYAEARAATVCAAIDFGDDNGAYPNDMECDDPRFEGPAAAMSLSLDNSGHDASDCAVQCVYGTVFLRDY